MKRSTVRLIAATMLICAITAQADTLVLRGGRKLDGTLLGASSREVDFMTADGKTQQIPITDIVSINFSMPEAASIPQKAAPAAKRPPVTIPQGTVIRVRTTEPIDVDASKAGMKFKASIDDPILVGGSVIVPRGADATLQASKVQQSGKMKGSDLIQLKINSIMTQGRSYPVVTTFQEVKGGSEGKSTAKKGIFGAGLGAIVGGVAGGGTGAAIGALAGGSAGLIISAAGEQHLKVPAESRLEFRLESAVTISY
jgi:outer membrane lipoprotein SlyB